MDQSDSRRLPWARYAAEVVTIVVGILLALAADAARQYGNDRAREREIMAALRAEFEQDEVEIAADQASRDTKLQYIARLRDFRSGMAGPLPLDSVPGFALRLNQFRFYTPSHPVLDETLATGRLDLLRSDSLRRALMVFQAERERLAVIEAQERDVVMSQVVPYLVARLDLDVLMSDAVGTERAAAAFLGIAVEPTFGSILYLNAATTELSRVYTERLIDSVEDVLRALGS